VARACGDPAPELTDAAAAAIEMIHCASLVHDDLPCFDAADTRRGRPAVHRQHGEDMAVLAGDSLIVEAFACLVAASGTHRGRQAVLVEILARASGMAAGISAGQAWETEPGVELERVHWAKTASLFEAACVLGAVSTGHDGGPWRDCGRLFGEAYQIADDVADATGDRDTLGKPVGQDARLDRPSMVQQHGLEEASRRLDERIQAAVEAIPACPGRRQLADALAAWARRLVPGT
jgi:geranylgeranyl diphosphate synthase type II